jgi:hypothetical protein
MLRRAQLATRLVDPSLGVLTAEERAELAGLELRAAAELPTAEQEATAREEERTREEIRWWGGRVLDWLGVLLSSVLGSAINRK